MLCTNAIALTSFLAFWHGRKGEPLSVVGFLAYSLNFLQMLVLFVVAQIRVFGSVGKLCVASQQSAGTSNNALLMQTKALQLYIAVQYFKLALIIGTMCAFACYARCKWLDQLTQGRGPKCDSSQGESGHG